MTRFEHQWNDFKWIDIEDPTAEELSSLAEELGLPQHPLSKCLDPQLLPTTDYHDNALMIVLRHQDDSRRRKKSLTIQELTTKLVVFVNKDFVLTVHRRPLPCVQNKKDKALSGEKFTKTSFLRHLIHRTILSFDGALIELDKETDVIEQHVFAQKKYDILKDGYIIKRKANAYRKVFKFTEDAINRFSSELKFSSRDMVHIREPLTKYSFFTDDIHDEITGLLNLHLSLISQRTNEASYRTNEIMRTLTVFSVFFLPLNFIAGLYGMNFDNMPALKNPYGYYATLAIMILISVFTLAWIYKRGWLKKDDM